MTDIEKRLTDIERRLPGPLTAFIELIWVLWIGFAVASLWIERADVQKQKQDEEVKAESSK